MKRILIASTFALSLLITSQVSAASITITKLGNNTWKPPYGVSEVYIDACGGGGGGGGGRKVKASGGGAGGSGEWVKNYRLPVSYGYDLTIFIPKGGVAGTGGGGDGGGGVTCGRVVWIHWKQWILFSNRPRWEQYSVLDNQVHRVDIIVVNPESEVLAAVGYQRPTHPDWP